MLFWIILEHGCRMNARMDWERYDYHNELQIKLIDAKFHDN